MANDLDLDELHEAVSALMDQSKSKKAGETSAANIAKPDEPITRSVEVTKTAPVPERVVDEDRVEVRRPLPSLSANRPRGRAMDFISPKPAPAVAPPSAKPKHQAPALQPTGQVKPEPVVPVRPEPAAQAEKLEQERPALNYQKPAPTEWPDPLDIHGFKDDEDKVETKVEAPAAPNMAEVPESSQSSYGGSPFLNTKVEKRPLGAYTADETPVGPKPQEAKPSEVSLDAIEEIKDATPQTVTETAEPQPDFSNEFAAESEPEDMRQAAIPQQYQSAAKNPNTDNRPIFDTKDYHPPINAAHAAHRGSSAMGWVLILVFAVVLIGALIFAFYVMTGGLDFSVLFS